MFMANHFSDGCLAAFNSAFMTSSCQFMKSSLNKIEFFCVLWIRIDGFYLPCQQEN